VSGESQRPQPRRGRAQEGGIGLFAHFRSKEDVQIELLTHLAGFALERIVRPSLTAAEGLPRLRALVRNWFGWAPRAGLPGGCPVAAGLFEFDDVEGRGARTRSWNWKASFVAC
jgi:AcrR family transcriptional regulator